MAEDMSVPPEYFRAMYARDPDPWRFASSDYERNKYADTLAAIGEARIDSALEIGCSIGVFTRALAPRCAALLAVDVAEAALVQARQRCADLPHLRFRRLCVPRQWPAGRFDLIVFSEVLYFLSTADIRLAAQKSAAALAPGGRIVLVNWTGETGHTHSGNEAAALFRESTAAAWHSDIRPGYRLDISNRPA
jgi:SAM-dependent methyltransferase